MLCSGLEEIPEVAIEVPEYGDGAVTFLPGLADKDNALTFVSVEVPPKIIGKEKEEDAPSGLITNA